MTCPICKGSGEREGRYRDLDCSAEGCTAATERAALEAAIKAAEPMTPYDERWEAYKAGKEAAIEQAIAKLDSINDKAGDRAAYDGDEMTMYETERMHAFAHAIEAIETLK